MSYTINYVFTFQNSPGLTLNAAIYDAANPTPAQVGSTITTGFSEIGYGTYSFWATLDDTQVGAFVVWDAADQTRRIAFSINPQEGGIKALITQLLATDTYAELSAVPAATSTLSDKINWLFALARNKIEQSTSTQTLYADDGSTTVATSAVSDDGSTLTRDEWS